MPEKVRVMSKNMVVIKANEAESNRMRHMLLGLIGGAVLGLLLKWAVPDPLHLSWIEDNLLSPVQSMLLHALILVSAPMIFFSILSGIANISDTASLGRIGGRLLLLSLPKLAFYVVLGLFVGDMLGGFASFPEMMAKDAVYETGTKLRDLIIGIVPADIVTPFHTNNVLQMLFLACFFGVMLAKAGDWADWAKNGVNFFSRFLMELLDILLPCLPWLVFVSMTKLVMHTGLASLLIFGKVVAAAALGIPIAMVISGMLVLSVGRCSPLPFVRKVARFIPLPFSLSNSTASMPFVLSFCRQKLGMEEKFTKFTISAGMQLNMDGTAFLCCYFIHDAGTHVSDPHGHGILCGLLPGAVFDCADRIGHHRYAVRLCGFWYPGDRCCHGHRHGADTRHVWHGAKRGGKYHHLLHRLQKRESGGRKSVSAKISNGSKLPILFLRKR